MVETKYKLTGLDCMECARGLEASISNLPFIEQVHLNFFDGSLVVRGDVDQKILRSLITSLGYGLAEGKEPSDDPVDAPRAVLGFGRYLLEQSETRLALIAGVVVLLSLILAWLRLPPWIAIAMQISALLIAGWPIARSGLTALWINHTFNINLLMTIAAIGAVVIGEYLEAASLILLFDIAEALESFTNARARSALSHMTALVPQTATVLQDGQENVVPVEHLAISDRIIVQPGEHIPMDGVILEGQSDINQAPITGESSPVWKGVGDAVYSGTVNGSGRLILEVTHVGRDSTLQRIIQMVTEAQSRQSRSQKFIDKFAKYYTPAMLLLAILVAAIPPLFFGEPFFNLADGTRGWLHRALVLLVIGCPCALVISTPVTIVASLTRAIKAGVLFKGGIFVEALSRMGSFAFDKTGTLTQGMPKVVACRALGCQGDKGCEDCNDMVALAYALERHSAHPIAQAIAEEAQWRGVTEAYPPANDLVARGGLGVEGTVNGQKMTIGNLKLFESEHDIPPEVHRWVEQAESEGQTAMLICDGERVRGFMAVADTPRPETSQVIHALNGMDRHTVMLTGDNPIVADAVGQTVGMQDVYASLLPGDKQGAIARLREQYGSVAMVGDGINDAPALAAADLGIAVGGSGNAQAMETADIVLMGDGLSKLPFAIKLSKFANRLIRQNIAFSLISKLLVAVIAFFGFAPLWLAVLADMGVSLLVTLNGLRAMVFEEK